MGAAELTIWRHEGIAVTTRDALLPKYAEVFERPGWSSNCKSLEQWRTGSGSTQSAEAKKQKPHKKAAGKQRRLAAQDLESEHEQPHQVPGAHAAAEFASSAVAVR